MHSARVQLALSVLGAMLLGSVIDGIIFALDANRTAASNLADFPPAWVVGSVWVLLFGLMGAAFWWVRQRGQSSPAGRPWQAWSIVALLLLCAAYPFYTGLFHSRQALLLGDYISLAATLLVMALCWPVARRGTALLAPTAIWLVYVTVLTLRTGG